MAEVIIIEDDDLEEGEITDDSVPEVYEVVSSFEAKRKKLPRHYALPETNSKHKKKCKLLTSHDNKQQNKVNPLPLSSSKKHKFSCPRRSLERPRFSNGHENSKKFNKFKEEKYSKGSPSSNNNFKNSMNPSTFVQRSVVKVISKQIDEDDNYVNLLLEYQKSQGHNHKRKVDSSAQNLSPKSKDDGKHLSNHKVEKSASCNPKASQKYDKECHSTHGGSQNQFEESSPCIKDVLLKEDVVDIEESEDEEELRRIALATCAKRIPPKENVQSSDHLISYKFGSLSNVPNLPQSKQSSVVCYPDNESKFSDNYEVVDMDIDQESCAEDDNDLYIIDTTPDISSSLKQCQEPEHNGLGESIRDANSLSLPNSRLYANSQSNEEFEEELLRAELIAGMNSRLKLLDQTKDNILVEIKPTENDKIVDIPFLQKECAITQSTSFVRPVLSSRNIPIKRTDLLKLSNVKLSRPTKISVPPTRSINANEKRFLISLSNDTSSDESDEEEKTDSSDIVAVSGIEALISDARQKSDLQANNVSCLSKAQQEEYNLLKKLLAEKDPMFSQPAVEEKQIPAKKPNVNFILKQLSVAKDKLKKEMQDKAVVEKIVVNKKKEYLASKLKVQHLKEQLHAAEQVRATNLDSWKTYETKLGVQKKLVLKRKGVVNMLENKLNNKKIDNEQNLSPLSL